MTLDELREKCEQLAPAGCAASRAVLELFDELHATRVVVDSLADRVYKQSELLNRRAEGVPSA